MVPLTTPRLGPILLWLACVFAPAPAHAEVLGETQVIARAHRWDPEFASAREESERASAEQLASAEHPNPSVAWQREHFPGAEGESEDALSLTLPLQSRAPREVTVQLAKSREAGANAQAARARSAAIERALYSFYDALFAAERTRLTAQALTRLEEAERVLARRHEEGTASGYDRARIELETEFARSEHRQAQAQAELSRRALARFLDLDVASIELRGELAPTVAPGNLEAAPASSAPPRPSIQFERSAATHANAASRTARETWLPNLALSGGVRLGAADDVRVGYVAGLSVELPLSTSAPRLRAEAAVAARHASARAEARARAVANQRLQASAELQLFEDERARFAEHTAAHVAKVEQAALSGYREGERSIVELLDAQRARASVAQRLLQLSLEARRAEIQLRAARGEFE